MTKRGRGYAGIQKRSRLPATGRAKTGACKAHLHKPRRSPRIAQLCVVRNTAKESNPRSSFPCPDGLSQTRPRYPPSETSQKASLQRPSLKRKRSQQIQQPSPPSQHQRSKRPRTSAPSTDDEQSQLAARDSPTAIDPLENWVLNERWPRELFEQDDQVREEILEHDSWQEEYMEQQQPLPVVQYVEINGFRYPRPIPKAPTSLRRKQSDSSLSGTSDQQKRENKSAAYRDTRYTTLLAAKGSYLRDFGDEDPPRTVVDPGRRLLSREQPVPRDTLFRDDLFRRCCRELADRNEAMIIQNITRLLVPSAQHLAIFGDRRLDILIENVNEAWAASIPVHGPRPQPDYSVGFKPSAFTKEQLDKLSPFVGTVFDTSFFAATYRMYFPFLTCEVKCGAAALDVADRQNAHSMTIAVRGVVELYRALEREKELDREILAFSISHDHQSVQIYGHYPVIDGNHVTFYRHQIRAFSFVDMDGKEKWTTYMFTRNVYDVWMPIHLARICSAIDQLPSGINFSVPQASDLRSLQGTQLSQDMVGLLSGASDTSQLGQEDEEQTPVLPQTATPDTSVSRNGAQGKAKRPKKNRTT